jgi:hypothetical protein
MGRISYHLINDEWKRVVLPGMDETDSKHLFIRAQFALMKSRADQIIILEPDGSGYQVRPILDKELRNIPQSEMTMIQLKADNFFKEH